MKKKKENLIIILMVIFLFLISLNLKAETFETNFYSIFLDKETIKKGFTINPFEDFILAIFPYVLTKETKIEFKIKTGQFLDQKKELINLPQNKALISEIYEFDLKNKEAYNLKKPLFLQINYQRDNLNLKEIYFWNKIRNQWQKLPSISYPQKKFVRAKIHLPFAKVALFEDKNIYETGYASWYRYKYCKCAASPDYPKGTLLKVTNLVNGKSIIVKVNDYGPDRKIFPDRVIDLDLTAFKQIARKELGIVRVKVEPLN